MTTAPPSGVEAAAQFTYFYEHYSRFLASTLRQRYPLDVELSLDLVQDTFSKAWTHWADAQAILAMAGEHAVRNWLTRIAYNTALDTLRHRAIEQRYVQPSSREAWAEHDLDSGDASTWEPATHDALPERMALVRESLEEVLRSAHTVDADRELLLLRGLGYSSTQAAQHASGYSGDAIKQRWYRWLQRVGHALHAEFDAAEATCA